MCDNPRWKLKIRQAAHQADYLSRTVRIPALDIAKANMARHQ
jgi:hypothetical protein